MSVSALAVTLQNASFLLEEALPNVVARSVSFDQALGFCTQLRRRGIALLLLQADVDGFLEDLAFSGRAFLHVLPRMPQEVRATGRQAPFFDALASGDTDCAVAIARESRGAWNQREELEDDFLYLWCLMSILVGGTESPAALETVARYEALTKDDEEPDARPSILRALLAHDVKALEQSLDSRMREVRENINGLRRSSVIGDEAAATEGSVSSEGLALVQLASRLGIRGRRNFLLVPSLAWKSALKPAVAERWSTEML